MNKKILLIDGHGLAFRGFYAVPEGLSAPDGTPTNAIVGFMNMLLKTFEKWQPDGVALFFDPKGETVRKKAYAQYKEGRKPAPDAFKAQMPLIIELSRAAGVPVFIRDGIEADDCIVSTARSLAAGGDTALILSADKDLLQILDKNIFVIRPTKGVSEFDFYDKAFFEKKYGFPSERMSDYLALLGDAVDNIPGVAGIGEKSAAELVQKYSSIEDIYEHIEDFKGAKRLRLEEGKQSAFDSRALVLPIEVEAVDAEDTKIRSADSELLKQLCERLGLRKIYAQLKILTGDFTLQDDSSDTPAKNAKSKAEFGNFLFGQENYVPQNAVNLKEVELGRLLSSENASMLVKTASDGETGVLCANGNGEYCFADTERLKNDEAWKKWTEKGVLTVFGLRGLLVDETIPVPPAERINDVEAAHYMLHPDRGGRGIEKTLGKLPEDKTLAVQLLNIYKTFENQLTEHQKELMKKLDNALSFTLTKMQRRGLPADAKMLSDLSSDLKTAIAKTETEIWEKAGEEFNLNSPKQVGHVLFEELGLPAIKKTKTGYSTGAEVLEELAQLPRPLCDVPKLLMNFREESKILSGFVEPFLALAQEREGRIHSTFDQLETGTGRLASYSPNVQNIPQFGEWAERFKKCLHPAAEDRTFVSADYSQIELRILAHLSQEERLLSAFREEQDVHLETASWVFGLPPEDITKEQRRFAKVVNFGLLYGMSAFGLAQRLGVPRPQAASIVKRYFSVLPGVEKYIEQSIKTAKEKGYTESVFGRRRPLSEVATIEGRGNNPIDRIAVNTPVQSAASDIAKMALAEFDKRLAEKFPNATVILQVHDSIVCECDENDADAVEKLLVETMEGVCKISVPLKVETKRGKSLNEV